MNLSKTKGLNIMKNVNKYISVLAVSAIALLVFSCDTGSFLNSPAKGALDKEVLGDEKGVNALLIGAYAALNGQGINGIYSTAGSNWLYGRDRKSTRLNSSHVSI